MWFQPSSTRTGRPADVRPSSPTPVQLRTVVSERLYAEAVKEALTVIWEAADRICGKRLKAVIS
jgi:hypothetical protein